VIVSYDLAKPDISSTSFSSSNLKKAYREFNVAVGKSALVLRDHSNEGRKEHFLFDRDRLLLATVAADSDVTRAVIGWAFANGKLRLPEKTLDNTFKFILQDINSGEVKEEKCSKQNAEECQVEFAKKTDIIQTNFRGVLIKGPLNGIIASSVAEDHKFWFDRPDKNFRNVILALVGQHIQAKLPDHFNNGNVADEAAAGLKVTTPYYDHPR